MMDVMVIKHGMYGTPEYFCWRDMRQRCANEARPDYRRYGGRGIKVCDRWQKFENFLADMGRRPSPKHSIDRINNDGDYEPGNCRWATAKEQADNRERRAEPGACRRGHPWTPETVMKNGKGRTCRLCRTERRTPTAA